MGSCLNVDIEENSNYPDWDPLKHRPLCNCKDNDKDLLEIINDQFRSGYHRGGGNLTIDDDPMNVRY